jgi:uncharacterized protein
MTNHDAPTAPRLLHLPGWGGSSLSHWQTEWARKFGDERVEQDDWDWPRRGDWMTRLEEVLLADQADARPAVLIAHSLGCHLVAAWAAHSKNTARVQAALLVAPPDLDRPEAPPQLHSWRPLVREPLPFRSLVVYSSNDAYASVDAALRLAADWGSASVGLGPRGHLNAESGLGLWDEGRALLNGLLRA